MTNLNRLSLRARTCVPWQARKLFAIPLNEARGLVIFLSVTFHKYNIYTRDLARAQAILFCHSSHSVLPLFSLSLAHPSSSSLVRNN